MRESDDGWEEGDRGGKGGRGVMVEGGAGCELETCFEILILGSGRRLEHGDGEEKKKSVVAGGTLKRGNVPCIPDAGAARTAMLVENNWGRCDVSPPAAPCSPGGTARIQSTLLLPPSPALTQMRRVVSLLIPRCLVKAAKGTLRAALTIVHSF